MSRYAVIDVETTGFSPRQNHRVLEVAVVLVDDQGQIVSEWETLVNPQREVANSEIHGLSAADLYSAPTFAQVAGELGAMLRGRVLVAHNLAFDASFLAAEFERVGHAIGLNGRSGLCTMRMASRYLPNSRRSLVECCRCIGCQLEESHAALADARAAARLLGHFLGQDPGFADQWQDRLAAGAHLAWPERIDTSGARPAPRRGRPVEAVHFVARLVSRVARLEGSREAEGYLAVLDRTLIDRRLCHHEQDELVAAAERMGLAREDVLVLHRRYLAALGQVALLDGIVTEEERADLEGVARLLGLCAADVGEALRPIEDRALVETPRGAFRLEVGDAIVFTGEAPSRDRATLEAEARGVGLRPSSGVSRKTRLLVAADPDSLSGKARKARELNVAVVDYAAYEALFQALARSLSSGIP